MYHIHDNILYLSTVSDLPFASNIYSVPGTHTPIHYSPTSGQLTNSSPLAMHVEILYYPRPHHTTNRGEEENKTSLLVCDLLLCVNIRAKHKETKDVNTNHPINGAKMVTCEMS